METIPKKDADFNVAQNNISNTASDNRSNWNLDSEWLDNELFPAREAWMNAWADCQVSATRTPLITFTKNEARKKYEKLLRQLVKILQANPKVTEDELKKMGIAIPSQGKTPAPVPVTYPVFTVDSSVIRRLSVYFRDNAGTSSAKPRGVHGAEIKWGIADTPPADPANLPNSSFDTRTPFTLEFAEADRGKSVYFCLRWENTTGAKGPWGEIGMAVIP